MKGTTPIIDIGKPVYARDFKSGDLSNDTFFDADLNLSNNTPKITCLNISNCLKLVAVLCYN